MKTFVSHDGTDGNGVRAEVYVQAGEGVVTEIKESANGTADVHFSVENLKFPVHGWIGQDNPVYEVVKKAKESGDKVSFRIEGQRKAKVERTTPIAELRADMKTARDNTISILASVNNIVSDEAVTNPDEDPASTYGRVKATGGEKTKAESGNSFVAGSALQILRDVSKEESVSNDIIAALAAQALLQGSTSEEVLKAISGPDRKDDSKPELRSSFSIEAPSWKAFNSDGRQNLGTSAIAAGVGAEQYVRSNLAKIVNPTVALLPEFNDAVEYFAKIILGISDKIQTSAYGQGFRADRSVASHARVRGLVYDTVTEFHNLPVTEKLEISEEKVAEWIKNVGKLSYSRFKLSIAIANDNTSLDSISIPTTLSSNVAPDKVSQQPEVVKEEVVVEKQADTVEVVTETVEPAKTETETASEKKEDSETVAETQVEDNEGGHIVDEEAETDEPVVLDYELLPQNLLDEAILIAGKLPSDVASTEETINLFKEFVNDIGLSKADLSKVAKLLAWTYGPKFSKVQNIPDDVLTDFIDFYVSLGEDNFVKALNGVAK